MTRWLVWMLALWLLAVLWAQALGVGLLVLAPGWVTAARRRWPRVVGWIERVHLQLLVALLAIGVLGVTVLLVRLLWDLPA
jgi:hypothetical protein